MMTSQFANAVYFVMLSCWALNSTSTDTQYNSLHSYLQISHNLKPNIHSVVL